MISPVQKDEKDELDEIMFLFKNRHNQSLSTENHIICEKNKFYRNMKDIISNKMSILSLSNFERDLLRSLKYISLRKSNQNKIHLGGSCIPGGSDKLFIDSKGNFYACEKLDFCFKLGDIENGINKERSYEILNKFIGFKIVNCINCWAKSICNYCFACFVDSKSMDFKIKRSLCYKAKKEGESLLKDYCNLLNEHKEETLLEYFRKT